MGFIPMKLICFSAIVSLFYLLFFNYFLSPAQTDATLLLANNYQHCWMLHVASVCTPCCMLLDVVACRCAKFETSETFQPKLPTFLLFCDRRSVAQQCWIRFHSSSNIVGATHAHLMHPFGHHCQHAHNNSQHCWCNNGSCCVRLHAALERITFSVRCWHH